MIDVKNAVPVRERNGQQPKGLDRPAIYVRSHGIRPEYVVLEIDGERYTVMGRDLKAAVRNAQNTSR